MMFQRATLLLLLSSSVAAFNLGPWGVKKATKNNLAKVLVAGVISAATLLPLPGPAVAADSLVIGTPLETKLANFGAASYPVFNSITDLSPLTDKLLEFVDKKVKAPDAADVANKAVDGLLAIPDSAISEYKGILRQVVYSGVSQDTCVTLGGSGSALNSIAGSPAVKSVDQSKIDALKTKFAPANAAVPVKEGGNICLPGSAAASSRLWVAQAELTFSMPKAEADALVTSIKKVGLQATRPSILTLVPTAEGVFSKSADAIKMVAAGKDVEPNVISTVQAAISK